MSVIDDLVTEFARLPGIGRKTAVRLTYHLLKQPRDRSQRLARALVELAERVRPCQRCYNLAEGALCPICADPRRDSAVICAVEEAADIAAIERAGEFRGTYHVLGGRLAPLDGVAADDLTIDALASRVHAGGVLEVIVATNPSVEGEATALYVQQQLRPLGVRVTRIARGLPMGGDLEYADGGTIAQAIAARRDMT
ncbi:MAG TPA: recombination mediator RecR [Gemmatimonadaceae bacterium]|nr:recombination mediator RecR [Gemmatimonadaceae bacterium]